LLDRFKENGIPTVVVRKPTDGDSSSDMWSRLLRSLRSLELISDANVILPSLPPLVKAWNTEFWRTATLPLLNKHYGPILKSIDISQASNKQFKKAFAAHVPRDQELRQKCEAFFLNWAQSAGFDLSQPLEQRVRMSATATVLKGAARETDRSSELEKLPMTLPIKSNGTPDPSQKANAIKQLLDKLPAFNPEWTPDVQAKWLESYARLTESLVK
jgi:hypothetical protein